MEDFIKAAVAAGASIAAAKIMYKKYQENKTNEKLGLKTKKLDDYVPMDVRNDIAHNVIDFRR